MSVEGNGQGEFGHAGMRETAAPRLARKLRRLVLAASLAGLVLAVAVAISVFRSDSQSAEPAEPDDHGSTIMPTIGEANFDGSLTISQRQFGESWPLTVSEAVLRCVPPMDALTLEVEDVTYALNAAAQNAGLGEALRPIWADDPQTEGARMSVELLLQQGAALCRAD